MAVLTLQRKFRLFASSSLCAYVRRQRLEQARQAIESGDASLSEAAAAAGYASVANFGTAFKRHHQLTPGQCRRRL